MTKTEVSPIRAFHVFLEQADAGARPRHPLEVRSKACTRLRGASGWHADNQHGPSERGMVADEPRPATTSSPSRSIKRCGSTLSKDLCPLMAGRKPSDFAAIGGIVAATVKAPPIEASAAVASPTS